MLGRPRRRGPRSPEARARRGPRTARHLLAEGLHPADDTLSRRLRLLHVRAPAAPRRAGVPDRGGGARDRPRRGGGRLPRGALHARGQARAALQGRARGAREPRVRDDARVPRALREARARRDRSPPAPEPRGHDPRTSSSRCGPVSASMGIMLETTAERLGERAARTGPLRTRSRRAGWRRSGSRASSPSRSRAGSSSGSARRARSGSTRYSR